MTEAPKHERLQTPAEKAAEQKAEEKKADAKPARGTLLRAAESSDPRVHQLLAQREAHVSNGGLEDDPQIEENRKIALAAIKVVDDELAELGFIAK
jgi:hypothetical protein